MWDVVNETPFAAESSWSRNAKGIHEWIVVIKGTFDVTSQGVLEVSEEQLAPRLEAEHHDDDPNASLRVDSDFWGPKPTTDIVLDSTAHAPGGQPSTEFPIFVRVGPVQKTLRVIGDRQWRRAGMASSPRPMLAVPVRYERAYGGCDDTEPDPRRWRMDPRNPVGRGVVARKERRIGELMPNFEYLHGDLERTGPAGLGPIAPHWSPRRELAGTYDERWQKTRAPLLPFDWSPHCLQSAPPDQQAPAPLRGGEPVELVNLSPRGTLRFQLPRVDFRFRTRVGRTVHEHPGKLASVFLEPERPRLTMTWQACLECPRDADYLEETIVSLTGRIGL